MFVKLFGSAVQGVDAITITIEVDTPGGLPGYFIVGLPDNAVKESIERILSATKNSGYERPRSKIVVNMAPADIRKAGSAYDLPIAIGMLAAITNSFRTFERLCHHGRTFFRRKPATHKRSIAHCYTSTKREIQGIYSSKAKCP